jgi:4-alpha-glucanotransferase
MKIGIIADIATGIDPAGSDCWGSPDDVLNGLRIGAPPDLFNAAGQNWGITALSPLNLRKNGLAPFVALLRANMAYAGGIRIDHAMGLMRLWVMPEGASPADGVYLRYPLDDMLRLLSLESHRARAIVIGEDLGTVPPGFSQTLADRGILGMQVLWFEHDPDGQLRAPSRWRREAVAMTTTHDLPTVAGWWNGRDIEWRAKAGIRTQKGNDAADREERTKLKEHLWSALRAADCVSSHQPDGAKSVIDGAICYVGNTPCRLAIVAAEDICGLEEQPNLPGTIDEHPNWRRRLPSGNCFSKPPVSDRVARLVRSRRS